MKVRNFLKWTASTSLIIAVVTAGIRESHGQAVTIANGADVAEGSTTDAPATVPTSAAAATTISLLKALNNSFVNGTQQIQGNIAGGTADSGNPVKIGGVFNSTMPTLAAGQRGDLQLSNFGGILAATSSTGADASTNVGAALNVGTGGSSNTSGALFNKGFMFNGTTWDRQRSINGAAAAGTGTAAVAIAPTSAAVGGITPVVTSAAANNLVLKAGAGNLYSAYATNLTATAGFLVIINATTAPADGAITPLDCAPLPASGFGSINYNPGPPSVYSTGITAVVTSAANCFTKTTGVITAYIKGAVQ
ncbi:MULTISPECIES: hypothetical protein [Bradyrhizobium]|uniref:hypothetical protein n=1 Tax=Bradyrhizobium TaxID=374 RepID=UPI0004BB58CB|nr:MULTISPECIES: hypothetical protein [Bradyrhizobium]MCS3451057.1 hypothetical protein [Bradyrhizobium elkanii]MCS3557797.1 hypothetical protein [Bradyrhizobium elkanii]MCW2152356.1 hypothetical protein [Bradyrhizobium elkanii]MCW2357768.1 hypothetical protein [Bradyrhizobium elkanii]MCW2376086.1 hypothetical protein [Bradyrhizobium elkanii]